MPNSSIAVMAFAAAMALTTAAPAQEAPQAPGAQQRAWDPAQMREQMRARMEARRAERLKALHDVLAIRPDQEAAFEAFATSMRPPQPPAGQDRRDSMGGDRAAVANLTTPQRLDRMAERMQARASRRQEAFARRAAATKALYAALNSDQRRTLDALPMLRGGDRRGGWGKGRGWRGHGGMGSHGQG